jgi:hypothetical protein
MSENPEMGDGPTSIACSAAAERMRAHRSRRRAGVRCLTIEIFEAEIDVLIRNGLLPTVSRNDKIAIREALHAHLDRTLSGAA